MRALRITGRKESKINTKKTISKQSNNCSCKGRLSIVGIGPGDISHLSQKAYNTILNCDIIVGYKTYLDLLGDLIKDKEIISSGMTQEIKRAKAAIQMAEEGKKVCIISSGDPGVYGMAGPVLELISLEKNQKFDTEVIPGIISIASCASLLGAPIMHDFAAISLSDLLTDLDLIKKRLELACKGDFVIVLYNPKSQKRTKPFMDALEILREYKSGDTPCGIVTNAYREGEDVIITTLKDIHLYKDKINMTTTIIIGNKETYIKGNFIITPRGYAKKSQ